MDAYIKAIEFIRKEKDSITIIDIGCARCAFINEFLVKYFEKSKIMSIGIDPLHHKDPYDAEKNYNFYIKGCVDNIPKGSEEKNNFYVNSIDQASSLLRIRTDNFSSNLNDKNKFYYPQEIIDRLSKIDNQIIVNVYNLGDIIDRCFGERTIDFIKIDAEGKDLDIAKSLVNYLQRIRFIAIECASHENKNLEIFENGSNSIDAINFFKNNNFEIFEITDYSKRENNLTQMSNIVFVNKNNII